MPVARRPESRSIFLSFLELLFGRWMIVVGIFVPAAFWAYLTLARAPDTYSAVSQVLIRRGKLQAVQDVPILRQQEELGSDVDILSSITVLNEVVRQILQNARHAGQFDSDPPRRIFETYEVDRPRYPLRLSDLPATEEPRLFKYLKDRFRIQKFGESNVIQVTLESPSPNFSAEAVNTLVEVYEKFNLTVEQSPGQSEFYAQEIRKADDEINVLQGQMADYMGSQRVIDTEKQQELLALRRYALVSELDKVQVDKAALETDLNAMSDPDPEETPAFLRSDELLLKMRADLILRIGELAQLRSKLTEENPLVAAKAEEVEVLQKKVAEEEERAIAQQRHLYRQVCDREAELRRKIAETDAEMAAYPHVVAQIDRFDRDIKQRTIKRADMVERMFKSTTLQSPDEAMNKVKVISYAPVPVLPVEARKDFKFLVAALFSLITAFLAAGFVENMDHSIRRRDEIEEHLGIPHLASIGTHRI